MKSNNSWGWFQANDRLICKSTWATDYPHPGYAWGATRATIEACGGVLDCDIVGSADVHMAFGFMGRISQSIQGKKPNIEFVRKLVEWEKKAKRYVNGNIGYVPVSIKHNWHGEKANRKYVDRWMILEDNNFNPSKDLYKDENGLYVIREGNQQLIDQLIAYFKERNEDD